MRRIAAVAVVLGVLAFGRADAAPASAHDVAFRSGLDQYGQGNYSGAIATWESLLTTMGEERGFKVLYNLGLAYQAMGDVTRAIERYQAFVGRVEKTKPVPPDLARRAEDAAKRVREIEESHGAVQLAAPKRGGLVLTRVNGGETRPAGYVIYLAPGVHTVEVFVGTERAKKVTLDVQKGKRIDVETTLPEDPPAAAPARPDRTEPPVTRDGPMRDGPPATRDGPTSARGVGAPAREGGAPAPSRDTTWLVTFGIATAVSVALPVSMFFVAKGKRDDATALGDTAPGYAAARSDYDTWRTVYLASWALPVILAGVTIGGFVLRTPSAKVSARATPSGLVLDGTF